MLLRMTSFLKKNPRAYEPWRGVEIELLKGALDKTNDLKTLSSCFGRSVNSIRTKAESILLSESADGHTSVRTDLSGLNDRQKDAVISENRRLLVLAGAGYSTDWVQCEPS